MKDLTNQLTCFVITAGDDPNINTCLSALEKQSCKFKLDIIKNYYPMSVAFQEMLNRCTTPYYIQIDGDMILNQNTVEKMYNEFAEDGNNAKVAMQCYLLRDAHLDIPIYGIKIYNYNIFKNYPYNIQHPSCEVEQLTRIEKDRYTYNLKAEVVGEHSPFWTDETIFERYYNLIQKFRIFKYIWLQQLPEKLFQIFAKNPTKQNYYAIAGLLSGIYEKNIMNEEKDVRKTRQDYGRLKSFFEKPISATVYATNKCNFKCEWCSRQHSELEHFPDTDPKLVETLLYKFPTITSVCICGFGETLLCTTLVSILQTIKRMGKVSGIITNGAYLKDKINELNNSVYRPHSISISLNAHNKEEHERVTKTKTWDVIMEGIQLALKTPIEIWVSSVVTTENLKHLPELIKLVHSLGIKTLHLHNLLPHFDGKLNNQSFWDLVLQSEHQKILDEYMKMPEASIVKKWPTLIDKTGGHQRCEFPWKSIAIDGNGSISICNSVLPCKKENGNINDFVVYNNDYCTKFRDDFMTKSNNLPCDKCFRNWKWI